MTTIRAFDSSVTCYGYFRIHLFCLHRGDVFNLRGGGQVGYRNEQRNGFRRLFFVDRVVADRNLVLVGQGQQA